MNNQHYIKLVIAFILAMILAIGLSVLNNKYIHFGLGGSYFECDTGKPEIVGDYVKSNSSLDNRICAVQDCNEFNDLQVPNDKGEIYVCAV
jgi:hypothetical protein